MNAEASKMDEAPKVLIVDDHEIVREGLTLLVEEVLPGSAFVYAADGREAVTAAYREAPDLVLLDLSMPQGLDGLSALGELRKALPEAKIVIFSMHEELAFMRRAYESGADGYIEKALGGEAIQAAIRRVLAGEKVFPPVVLKGGDAPALPLSPREQEVLVLTVLGHSQKEIAERLQISPKTVENHRTNITRKLGTNKKSDWLAIAKRHGLLDLY